jgi:hypothetical protein
MKNSLESLSSKFEVAEEGSVTLETDKRNHQI